MDTKRSEAEKRMDVALKVSQKLHEDAATKMKELSKNRKGFPYFGDVGFCDLMEVLAKILGDNDFSRLISGATTHEVAHAAFLIGFGVGQKLITNPESIKEFFPDEEKDFDLNDLKSESKKTDGRKALIQ